MPDDRLPLADLLPKAGDGDSLRGVAEAVLQMLVQADVEGLIGAGRHLTSDVAVQNNITRTTSHCCRAASDQKIRSVWQPCRPKRPSINGFLEVSNWATAPLKRIATSAERAPGGFQQPLVTILRSCKHAALKKRNATYG